MAATILVEYRLVTRSPVVERGSYRVALPAQRRLCRRDIAQAFPYQGGFFFRAKATLKGAASGGRSGKYVWFDLVADDSPVPLAPGRAGVVVIKAVPTFDLLPETLKAVAAEQEELWSSQASPEIATAVVKACGPDGNMSLPSAATQAVEDARLARGLAQALPPFRAAGADKVVDQLSDVGRLCGNVGLDGEPAPGSGRRPANAAAAATGKAAATAGQAATAAAAAEAPSGSSWSLLKTVTRAGKRLAEGVRKAATAAGEMLAAGSLPTEAALVNLQAAEIDFRTTFRPGFRPHELLLERFWVAVGAARPAAVEKSDHPASGVLQELGDYSRVGPAWERLGFRSEDPGEAMKEAGILGLKALVYSAEWHGSRLRGVLVSNAMVADDSRRLLVAETWVAVAGVVAEVTRATQVDSIATQKRVWWTLFEHPDGFWELCHIASVAFTELWFRNGRRQAEFQTQLGQLAELVTEWLEAAPGDLLHLRSIVEEEQGVVLS